MLISYGLLVICVACVCIVNAIDNGEKYITKIVMFKCMIN